MSRDNPAWGRTEAEKKRSEQARAQNAYDALALVQVTTDDHHVLTMPVDSVSHWVAYTGLLTDVYMLNGNVHRITMPATDFGMLYATVKTKQSDV